jgi:hypothetical protein
MGGDYTHSQRVVSLFDHLPWDKYQYTPYTPSQLTAPGFGLPSLGSRELRPSRDSPITQRGSEILPASEESISEGGLRESGLDAVGQRC